MARARRCSLVAAAAVAVAWAPCPAHAQASAAPAAGSPAAPPPPREVAQGRAGVETLVARALFDQGLKLMEEGRFAEAMRLFEEAASREPQGPYGEGARELAAACARRLAAPPAPAEPPATPPPRGPRLTGRPVRSPLRDPYPASPPLRDPYPGVGVARDRYRSLFPRDPFARADRRPAVRDPYPGHPPVRDPYAGGGARSTDRPGAPPAPWATGGEPDGDPLARFDGLPEQGLGHPTVERAPPPPWRAARRARTVLALGVGLFGFAGATAAQAAADGALTDRDGWLLTSTVGGAAGVGAAYLYASSRGDDLGEGEAMTLVASELWMGWNAGALTALGDGGQEGITRGALLGGVGGLVGGALLGRSTRPDPASVSLVDSAGAWGLAGGLLVAGLLQPAEDRTILVPALVGSDAGLLGGLLLAPRTRLSRRRLAMMDVGGALGALGGYLLSLPFARRAEEPAPGARFDDRVAVSSGFALGGLVGGLAAALALTSDEDRDDAPVVTGPAAPPALVRLELGRPPRLGPPLVRRGDGGPGGALLIDLAAGTF